MTLSIATVAAVDEWDTAWAYTLCTSLDPDGWNIPWGTGTCPVLAMVDAEYEPVPILTVEEHAMPGALVQVDSTRLTALVVGAPPVRSLGVIVEGRGRWFEEEEVPAAAAADDLLGDPSAMEVRVLYGLHPSGGYVACHHMRGTDIVVVRRAGGLYGYVGFTDSDRELLTNLALLGLELGC